MSPSQFSGGAGSGYWRKWMWLAIAFVIVGTLVIAMLGKIDMLVPDWAYGLLRGQERAGTDQAEDLGTALGAEAREEQARAVTGAKEAAAQVKEALHDIARHHQSAMEALPLPDDTSDDAAEGFDQQRMESLQEALRNLGKDVRQAYSGVDDLEGELGDVSRTLGSDGPITSAIFLGLLAAIGWLGWLVTYLLGEKRRRHGRKFQHRHDPLEERIGNIETQLSALGTQRHERFDDSARRINEVEDRVDALGREMARLQSNLEEALSSVGELSRQWRQHDVPSLDAGSQDSSWERSSSSQFEHPSTHQPTPPRRYHGPVREIRTQLPNSAQDMEFAPTHELLVRKQSAAGKKFKVFLDNQSRSYKVIPLVDSAHHRDQLAWLQKVFDVQWNGGGEVKLLADPTLEPTSEGFKVRTKGRLSVG